MPAGRRANPFTQAPASSPRAGRATPNSVVKLKTDLVPSPPKGRPEGKALRGSRCQSHQCQTPESAKVEKLSTFRQNGNRTVDDN